MHAATRIHFSTRQDYKGNRSISFSRHKIFFRLLPTHNVPPVCDVLRAAILILEVVSMLPNVQPKHWCARNISQRGHERVVLVWSRSNGKTTFRCQNQPRPSGSKASGCCCIKFFLHGIHRTKVLFNGLFQRARRACRGGRIAHNFPKESMIPMSTSIVAHRRSYLGRNFGGSRLFVYVDEAETLELRKLVKSGIQVIDIRLNILGRKKEKKIFCE
jgi:hypothetical protein